MTRFVITLEMFGPLLLFLPICVGPARTLAVVLFGGFHLGILLGMRIGIFPIACIVAWLAVLPTWFWQKLGAAGDRAAVPRRPPWRQSAAALGIVGYVCAWNVVTVRTGTEPGGLFGAPGYMLRVDQRWAMFSPEPSLRTRFLIARGETVAGKTVDLLREGPAPGHPRASRRLPGAAMGFPAFRRAASDGRGPVARRRGDTHTPRKRASGRPRPARSRARELPSRSGRIGTLTVPQDRLHPRDVARQEHLYVLLDLVDVSGEVVLHTADVPGPTLPNSISTLRRRVSNP